jgi:hypothetical protein
LKKHFEALRSQGRVLDMKWADVQKTPDKVSRHVVREIKAQKKGDDELNPARRVFAAMPPVEGLQALISHMMTECYNEKGRRLSIATLDVSRAHSYGESEGAVYTCLPEGYKEDGVAALLCRTMYGTEDAAHIWWKTRSTHLENNGYSLGSASPSLLIWKWCSRSLPWRRRL